MVLFYQDIEGVTRVEKSNCPGTVLQTQKEAE